MKRLLLFIFLGLLAGLLFTQFYDCHLDPGANYFERAAQKSDAWHDALRRESSAPCFVFAGGSEVRMCLDPKLMKDEFGVRVINAGGMAGYGIRCNAALGVDYLRPGDCLILSIRSTRLKDDPGMTTSGLKFCWRRLGYRMFSSDLIPLSRDSISHIFRGRSGELSMHLAKKIFRPDDIYKYDTNTRLHESGWCENFHKEGRMHCQFFSPSPHLDLSFDEPMLLFLQQLKAACNARGAQLAIYMAPEALHDSVRTLSAIIAYQFTAAGIPVLKDPSFGCTDNQNFLADRPNHLTPEGTRHFSRIFAASLASPSPFWSLPDLESFIRARGYSPSGALLER